jgi:hypothetical protein
MRGLPSTRLTLATDFGCSPNRHATRFGRLCMGADRPIGSNAVFYSCATTRPAGPGPPLRVARAARKPCASPERRGGLTGYPICTYLNAERARRPIPRKQLRQPKPKQRQKSAPGISMSLVTPHAKSRDADREQKGSQPWMRRQGIVGVQQTNLAQDRC